MTPAPAPAPAPVPTRTQASSNASDATVWVCPACTFDNEFDVDICAVSHHSPAVDHVIRFATSPSRLPPTETTVRASLVRPGALLSASPWLHRGGQRCCLRAQCSAAWLGCSHNTRLLCPAPAQALTQSAFGSGRGANTEFKQEQQVAQPRAEADADLQQSSQPPLGSRLVRRRRHNRAKCAMLLQIEPPIEIPYFVKPKQAYGQYVTINCNCTFVGF